MATIHASQFPVDWAFQDFPHNQWPSAYVKVNGELVVPQLVEFGNASTGQACLIVTFNDGSQLNVWLDPDFPKKHLRDYAVWKKSPFYDLTLSTCPEWKHRKCNSCQVKVEIWKPLDEVRVDLRFCERDDHRRMSDIPHAYICIRSHGVVQKRLGDA
jgi:hypothetical protein